MILTIQTPYSWCYGLRAWWHVQWSNIPSWNNAFLLLLWKKLCTGAFWICWLSVVRCSVSLRMYSCYHKELKSTASFLTNFYFLMWRFVCNICHRCIIMIMSLKFCAFSLAICLMSLKLRLCLILPLSFLIILSFTNVRRTRGGVVVKALRYKPAGRAFTSRWCHWNFSVT